MTELLPCPFCGSPGAICSWENESGFWVNCSCGVETPENSTEARAAEQWNRRIPVLAQSAGYGETTEEFSLYRHLYRQREWSSQMFGPGSRTQGITDHIRKELGEIEAVPADVTEWIDVVILALDGAWRTGATPGQIIAALVAKQTKNEGRVWPDWRTADPNKAIEHVKASEHTEGQRGPEEIIFWYKNYRGEEGYRRVTPISLRFGTSEWHTRPQWLMLGRDEEKGAEREFALADVKNIVGSFSLAFGPSQHPSTK